MDHYNSFSEFQIRFLPPVYGLEFCVALLGNALALWLLVTRERRDWHTGVVFSCNLAISDLLYVLTLPLLLLYYAGGKDWRFGPSACKLERFLFTCNLYVSIFFIMCISVNRYVAIVHPFFTRSHVRPRHAAAAAVLVWALVAAISSPVLGFAGTCLRNGTNATECVSCCGVGQEEQRRHLAYSLSLAAFGCLLPFLATFASYAAIFRVVLRNRSITPLEKRKVLLMVSSVLVLYTVSFMPYHVLRNLHFYLKMHNLGWSRPGVHRAYQVSKGLVTLNMCIHPLLYMALFDSIRTVCCRGGGEDRDADRAGERS
ncbi:P2Y purinoceptor 11 [Megalops cyprinoides]|uniref:P2Y purinoceptor 11 n=1 Tax=Megalops cyprinoides TaxID=118141 RepID=UPI00186417BC|nr:P2Y purinoceptor 11 [Megalops cyprinoides]